MTGLIERLNKAKGSPILKTVLLGMFDAERTCLEAAVRIAELEARIAQARNDALEEAALWLDMIDEDCAKGIRALKTPEGKDND